MNYCHLELDNCALQQYANFRPLQVVESSVCVAKSDEATEKPASVTTVCPKGVTGSDCDMCRPNYWAFTSFGCKGKKAHLPGAQ